VTELVIFDLDGVLIDSETLVCRAVAETLSDRGFAVTESDMIERFVGVSHTIVLDTLSREAGLPLPDDFDERARDRLEQLFAADLRAIAGAHELLAGLSRPRCVASNSPADYIVRSLALVGLSAHFAAEALFSAEHVERPKPAPDLFLHAAATMGSVPERCLVVEDSVAGATAAQAAGMTVIGFVGAGHLTDRAAHGEKLRAAGAQEVLHDLLELRRLLETAD
jgi:HAD superfamily hydrolase (TIGR01509 family)